MLSVYSGLYSDPLLRSLCWALFVYLMLLSVLCVRSDTPTHTLAHLHDGGALPAFVPWAFPSVS